MEQKEGKDRDTDEEKEKQGSNKNNEKQEQVIDEMKKQKLLIALRSLKQQRIQRAKRNPDNEARFREHKNAPKSYSLSDGEKRLIVYRLQERLLKEMYSDPPIPKFFRPPKYPNRPSTTSPLPEQPSPISMLLPQEPSHLPPKKRKIPGENWSNRSNKGIVIASKKTEKEEEHVDDEDDEFKEYKAAIYKPVKSNMNELYEISKKIKDKTIKSLEGKIYALLHKGEDKVFKNYDKEPKRSFHEWVNDCKDLERLNKLKAEAIHSGYAVCRTIVDLMFLMSEHKANEMGKKLQAFEEALGVVDRGENTVVISRVLEVLLAAQIHLKTKKYLEMEERGFRGKEVMIEDEKVRTPDYDDDDDDDVKAPFPDMIIFQLVKVIFKMELFWVQRRLPCAMRLLIQKFPSLERETSRFELTLMRIDNQIEDSLQEGRFGIVSGDWRDCADYFDMEWIMDELWRQLID